MCHCWTSFRSIDDNCAKRSVAEVHGLNVEGSMEIIPITPGRTLAGASLQVDVQKAMRPKAAMRLNCDERGVRVTDTAILSRDDPWRENWLFAGCGTGDDDDDRSHGRRQRRMGFYLGESKPLTIRPL
jgi:hypothetical protein